MSQPQANGVPVNVLLTLLILLLFAMWLSSKADNEELQRKLNAEHFQYQSLHEDSIRNADKMQAILDKCGKKCQE